MIPWDDARLTLKGLNGISIGLAVYAQNDTEDEQISACVTPRKRRSSKEAGPACLDVLITNSGT